MLRRNFVENENRGSLESFCEFNFPRTKRDIADTTSEVVRSARDVSFNDLNTQPTLTPAANDAKNIQASNSILSLVKESTHTTTLRRSQKKVSFRGILFIAEVPIQ